MAANTPSNFLKRRSFQKASDLLGLSIEEAVHLAGTGELPVYVDLHSGFVDVDSIDAMGIVSEPVEQRLNEYNSKNEPGAGITAYRRNGIGPTNLVGMKHEARLLVIDGEEANHPHSWRKARVSLQGQWQVAKWHFHVLDRQGEDTLASAMLSAISKDGKGEIRLSGVRLPPFSDTPLWVMADDLRRLSLGATPVAKAKTSRQPKSNVTDFIEQLITLLPSQSEQKRAQEERDLIEMADCPNDTAIALALRLISAIPDLARETKSATIYNVIEVMLIPQPPAIGRRTLSDWMKNNQEVADNS